MGIGEMRERVLLQRVQETDDGIGGLTEAAVSLGEVWAEAASLSLESQLLASRAGQKASQRFRIRYRSDVGVGVEAVWRDRTYVCVAVEEVAPRRFLWLTCEEKR